MAAHTVEQLRQADSSKAGPDAAAAPPAPRRTFDRRAMLVVGAAAAALAAGALWITATPSSESTDDAYLEADSTTVAPKVRGLVEAVLVKDNQAVRAGDPLIRIDPEEFDARVRTAAAELSDADAEISAAKAALESLTAEQRLATANIAAARTSIRSSDAEARRAATDRERYNALASTGAVAARDAERYRTTAVEAEQAARHARAQLAVSRQEAGVVSARRAGLQAALAKAKATRLRAVAALDLARQDRNHTIIRAAVSGIVGNRQVRVGDYVQPGSRLLSIVPVQDLYVTAYFKETQTRHMRPGQSAEIYIDALGASMSGKVESLAPGSGSTFSLLPFEPGTGNFTKIVQRVPVRIRFDERRPGPAPLRPGLSVSAKVRFAN